MTGVKGKSGGARPVLPHHQRRGPKRKLTPQFRKGETLLSERQTLAGDINERRELWTVLSVGADEIEFQCGDDIIVVRRPDEDD